MKNPQTVRAFLLAFVGVALGIALAKLTSGSLVPILAIVVGVGCFLLYRMRSGR